jgi:ABC-type antimicrobial peptide transport system permease subunit
MKIPLNYILRNMLKRRLTTLLTAGGMALVVYVFATVLMMRAGLEQTLADTGIASNVVAIRKGSQTEVQSGLSRSEAAIIESDPNVALDGQGRRLASKETDVLISLARHGSGKKSNIVVRGTSNIGLAIRPQVKIIAGRLFNPGSSEVMVGRAIAEGFDGVQLGSTLRFGRREWTVVGVFDAGRTGFNSEVWGDAEQMMQSFRRQNFSAVVFRMQDSDVFDATQSRLEGDPRMTAEFKRETRFYADQSQAMSTFIGWLGIALSIVFSLGAIIGAMITMYAAVSNRVGEIGALRALGFPRRSVMAAFLLEALSLSLLGGIMGLVPAACMQVVTVSTMNFQTFSELAFSFTLTPGIVLASLIFALGMGLIGGFLPAARAASMKIVDALRAA